MNFGLYAATDPEPYLRAVRAAGPPEPDSPSGIATDLAVIVHGIQATPEGNPVPPVPEAGGTGARGAAPQPKRQP